VESPILLVTDEPALAAPIDAGLKPHGLGVIHCEPTRCISMTAQSVPSLVLLDMRIHTVAWPSVLSALLTEARTRGVPVVGLTSEDPGPHVLPVVAGMHDVLLLPLDAARLEQLSTLVITLGFQFGSAGSEPGSAAADRVVLYAERSGVSGTLERGPLGAAAGKATFSLGALASCQFQGRDGRAALAALLSATGELRFQSGTAAAPVVQEAPVMESLDASLLETLEPVLSPLSFDPPPEEKTVVLAVDDDPDILGLVSAFLTKEGFDVRTACDGEEGFSTAVALRPGAIVSDLEMPFLDGWGMLKKIRADYRVADTPLLFLSAAEDFRMSIQAAAAGAQDYLSKSGAREQLSIKLRNALAPRLELELAMRSQCPARSRVELTGAKWTLLRLAELATQGSVIVADGFGVHEVAFENGELRSADSTLGAKTLAGSLALEAFLGVRTGDLVTVHTTRRPANLSGRVAETVEAAAVRCNAAEALAVTRALTSRSGVMIDVDLCALYEKFGPVPGRAVASALRGGAAPFDLLAQSANPLDVERVLRDLARRRVILVDR